MSKGKIIAGTLAGIICAGAIASGGVYGVKLLKDRDKTIEDQKTTIGQLEEENNVSKEKIEQLTNDLSAKVSELAEKDKQIADKDNLISENNHKIQTLNSQKTTLLASVAEIDNKLTSTIDAVDIDNLEARKNAILVQIDTLNTEIANLTAEKTQLQQEVVALTTEKTQLQKQIDDLQKSAQTIITKSYSYSIAYCDAESNTVTSIADNTSSISRETFATIVEHKDELKPYSVDEFAYIQNDVLNISLLTSIGSKMATVNDDNYKCNVNFYLGVGSISSASTSDYELAKITNLDAFIEKISSFDSLNCALRNVNFVTANEDGVTNITDMTADIIIGMPSTNLDLFDCVELPSLSAERLNTTITGFVDNECYNINYTTADKTIVNSSTGQVENIEFVSWDKNSSVLKFKKTLTDEEIVLTNVNLFFIGDSRFVYGIQSCEWSGHSFGI